jgi:hypothetical protein
VYLSPGTSASNPGSATLAAGQVLALVFTDSTSPGTGKNPESGGTNVVAGVSPSSSWSWYDTGGGGPLFDLQICNDNNKTCYTTSSGGSDPTYTSHPGYQFQLSGDQGSDFNLGVYYGQSDGNQQNQINQGGWSTTGPNVIGPDSGKDSTIPIEWVSQTGGFGTNVPCGASGCSGVTSSINQQLYFGLRLKYGGTAADPDYYYGWLLADAAESPADGLGDAYPTVSIVDALISTVPNYYVSVQKPNSAVIWPLSSPNGIWPQPISS